MQHSVMPSLCCAGMHPTTACLTHDDEGNMLFCLHGAQQLMVHTLKLQGQGASCEVSPMVCSTFAQCCQAAAVPAAIAQLLSLNTGCAHAAHQAQSNVQLRVEEAAFQ